MHVSSGSAALHFKTGNADNWCEMETIPQKFAYVQIENLKPGVWECYEILRPVKRGKTELTVLEAQMNISLNQTGLCILQIATRPSPFASIVSVFKNMLVILSSGDIRAYVSQPRERAAHCLTPRTEFQMTQKRQQNWNVWFLFQWAVLPCGYGEVLARWLKSTTVHRKRAPLSKRPLDSG